MALWCSVFSYFPYTLWFKIKLSDFEVSHLCMEIVEPPLKPETKCISFRLKLCSMILSMTNIWDNFPQRNVEILHIQKSMHCLSNSGTDTVCALYTTLQYGWDTEQAQKARFWTIENQSLNKIKLLTMQRLSGHEPSSPLTTPPQHNPTMHTSYTWVRNHGECLLRKVMMTWLPQFLGLWRRLCAEAGNGEKPCAGVRTDNGSITGAANDLVMCVCVSQYGYFIMRNFATFMRDRRIWDAVSIPLHSSVCRRARPPLWPCPNLITPLTTPP